MNTYKFSKISLMLNLNGIDVFMFCINNIEFFFNLSSSKLIFCFFIDEKSDMFNYIKSDKFVDDLQLELFNENIMDYSAEEIQWIIVKDGLCKNAELCEYIKETIIKYNHKDNNNNKISLPSTVLSYININFKLDPFRVYKYMFPYISDNYPKIFYKYYLHKPINNHDPFTTYMPKSNDIN